MGITKVKANILNPAHPTKKALLEFLVDSGTAYSVAPRTQLKKLGILLGVVTLEAPGFVLDPLRRELKPLPMLLMQIAR